MGVCAVCASEREWKKMMIKDEEEEDGVGGKGRKKDENYL